MARVPGIVLIFILALGATQGARAAHPRIQPRCCPAPPIYVYPSVARWDGHGWEPAQVLTLGVRVRFTLRFYTPQAGWRFPSGTFEVQRLRTPQFAQPALAQVALHREHSYSMYRILTAELQIGGKQWLGNLLGQFNLRNNGSASIGTSVEFLVQRPPAPKLWTVHDALAECSGHPKLRAAMWVRGSFEWLAPSGPPYNGWLSDTPITHPVSRSRVLYVVLPVRYVKGNLGPPPNGPLFAHGVLECASKQLIQDRYPLFP